MKLSFHSTLFPLAIFTLFLTTFLACEPAPPAETGPTPMEIRQDSLNFLTALNMHLDAVKNKDFEALKRTMPAPEADFHLILPNGAMMDKSGDFLDAHQEWFQDTSWTMESKILHAENGPEFGIALVEATNREPERNGKPYFHKMAISYGLKKINGIWLVVYDHASTMEKSE